MEQQSVVPVIDVTNALNHDSLPLPPFRRPSPAPHSIPIPVLTAERRLAEGDDRGVRVGQVGGA